MDDFKGLDTGEPECWMKGVQVHDLSALRFLGKQVLNLKI